MTYNAFGAVTFRTADFTARAESLYSWNRTFTGQVLDTETGLLLYRNRYYHTGLGRFTTRDPIGYEAQDVSLYRYVRNTPQIHSDFLGLLLSLDPHICGGCNCDCPVCNPQNLPDLTDWPPEPKLPKPKLPKPHPTPEIGTDGTITCPEGYSLKQKESNPPKGNGCGPKGQTVTMRAGINLLQMSVGQFNLIFDTLCNKHDLCYGGCGASKDSCDSAFLRGMLNECNRRYGGPTPYFGNPHISSLHHCTNMASLFYTVVNSGGGGAFSNAVNDHCECQCD